MDSNTHLFLSQRELAQRWGRSESVIGLARSVGVGPRYVKVDGEIRYPVDEVQIYERACLFFDPAEVALQSIMH